MAWTSKTNTECGYDLCVHGGRIRVGEEITWNRSEAGRKFHVDCFQKIKGVIKTPKAVKLVSLLVTEDDEPEATAEPSTELRHYLYPVLKHYVVMRQHVYLHGAPGSGKSFVAQQIADELGLNFAFISVNPQSPASLLLGFMNPNLNGVGVYQETPFFKCWRDGGVFLFDEEDNCSSSILTILNGMLASNQASFPCGMVPKHKNFVFIGTGNTTGRGGDWQFPERRKIDEASIDRLAFIAWDYDADLERSLALAIEPKAGAWVNWVQCIRAYVRNRANGIKGGVYCTPRASMSGAKDIPMIGKPYFSVAELAERHVFKGTDSDTVARILANCPLPRY